MIEKISEMKKALDEVLKNGISSMKCYCEICEFEFFYSFIFFIINLKELKSLQEAKDLRT